MEKGIVVEIDRSTKILDKGNQFDAFTYSYCVVRRHKILLLMNFFKNVNCFNGFDSKTLQWIDSFLCYGQGRIIVNGAKSRGLGFCLVLTKQCSRSHIIYFPFI